MVRPQGPAAPVAGRRAPSHERQVPTHGTIISFQQEEVAVAVADGECALREHLPSIALAIRRGLVAEVRKIQLAEGGILVTQQNVPVFSGHLSTARGSGQAYELDCADPLKDVPWQLTLTRDRNFTDFRAGYQATINGTLDWSDEDEDDDGFGTAGLA